MIAALLLLTGIALVSQLEHDDSNQPNQPVQPLVQPVQRPRHLSRSRSVSRRRRGWSRRGGRRIRTPVYFTVLLQIPQSSNF